MKSARQILIDMIRIDSLEWYLEENGWTCATTHGYSALYRTRDDESRELEIWVPLQKSASFRQRVVEIIKILSDIEDRCEEKVLADLLVLSEINRVEARKARKSAV